MDSSQDKMGHEGSAHIAETEAKREFQSTPHVPVPAINKIQPLTASSEAGGATGQQTFVPAASLPTQQHDSPMQPALHTRTGPEAKFEEDFKSAEDNPEYRQTKSVHETTQPEDRLPSTVIQSNAGVYGEHGLANNAQSSEQAWVPVEQVRIPDPVVPQPLRPEQAENSPSKMPAKSEGDDYRPLSHDSQPRSAPPAMGIDRPQPNPAAVHQTQSSHELRSQPEPIASSNGLKLPSISKGYLSGFSDDNKFQNRPQLPRIGDQEWKSPQLAPINPGNQQFAQLRGVTRFETQSATASPQSLPLQPVQQIQQSAQQPQQQPQQHQPELVPSQTQQEIQQSRQTQQSPNAQQVQQPAQSQTPQQQPSQPQPQPAQQPPQQSQQPHVPAAQPAPPSTVMSSQQMVMGYMPMYQYGHQFQQPQQHLGYIPQQQPQQQLQPPLPPQQTPVPVSTAPNDYRPLNVKDALSYLEQVKLQFSDQPDVYNHFLDIMKDFKSHAIDTPGVIDRVSSLFRGHNNLIQGFNTFLPAGYSILCSSDPNDPNPIRVVTPMGSQTLPHMLNATSQQQQQQIQNQQPQGQPSVPGHLQSQQGGSRTVGHNQNSVQQQVKHAQQLHIHRQQVHANAHLHVQAQQVQQQVQQPTQHHTQQPLQYGYAIQPGQTTGAIQSNAAMMNQASPTPEQRLGPVEFSHAISYVNKIKNHFSSQPEIYKQFLEILQTYQREQLRISEVYSQVRHLFKDAPDLLEGFKNFLPDTNGTGEESSESQLPPMGNFDPPPVSGVNAVAVAAGSPPLPSAQPHKPTATHNGSAMQSINGQMQVSSVRKPRDQLVPPAKPLGGRSNVSEEFSFFDKVKKSMPKSTYHEFLKTLNLFTQQIIDVVALVSEVEPFLSSQPELLDWFKQFVGYEGEPLHIENISQRKHLIDLSQCRSYGRSYRLLPKTERFMPCSGRDELGWEVFNDEWVGHPTWASEDSGFVAHRKNQYEEIMFRVEEERHEYDHYIGANQRTIQVLEAIANRMASMSSAEVAAFKLPEGLGHGSKIYQKVIRKIYDKKNGDEVIAALHENPGAALPVVLRRLKQKDEEWRRAHREWNKVWREAERKAYYKSLDHLGLTFKQADRKRLTPRALLAEIMAVNAEQMAKRRLAATNIPPVTVPKAQLDFKVDDYSVIADVQNLVIKYIDFRPTMSAHDKSLCKRFLDVFVEEFFSQDPIQEKKLSSVLAETSSVENDDDENNANHSDDFNKAAKDSDKSVDKSDVSMKDVTNSSTSNDTETVDDAIPSSWLKLDRSNPPLLEKPKPRAQYNLFGSTPIYLFLRIFEIIYSRLSEVKGVEKIVSETLLNSRQTPFAVELGLYDDSLAQMGLQFVPENVYEQTLKLCHRLLEEDVEAQWFEEALRQAYRNRAYKLYTIDKALQSLTKQLHAAITDTGSVNALLAWEKDRALPETNVKSQIELRMRAKQALSGVAGASGVTDTYGAAESSEPLFRIAWSPRENKLSFQSLGPFDITLKGAMDEQKQWEYYLTSYTMSLPTEGVPLDQIRAPVLQRVIPEEVQDCNYVIVAEDLQARILFNSYKLFFEAGTADYLLNVGTRGNPEKAKAIRSERWKETLNSAEEALAVAEAEAAQQEVNNKVEANGENHDNAQQPVYQSGKNVKPNVEAEEPDHDDAKMDVDEDKNESLSSSEQPTSKMLAAQPRLEYQSVGVVLPKPE